MGTKNNPGAFDCYKNADPDEPMFVLLARDPLAPLLVSLWATIRERAGEGPEKVEEARVCASSMVDWLVTHANEEKQRKAFAIAALWDKLGLQKPTIRTESSKR